MKVIVDTNRIISALIKEGLARAIITSLKIEFYTLDYVLEEIRKYISYITEKSGLNSEEIELLLLLFMQNITVLPDEKVKSKISDAMEIMKEIDINDAPILACALAVQNDGIWTEDKHFEKQNTIKVLKDEELLNYI